MANRQNAEEVKSTGSKFFGTGGGWTSNNEAVAGMGPAASIEDPEMKKPIRLGEVFPDKTVEYVKGTARRTAARLGFSDEEKEDFEQNIFLCLLKKMKKYDSSRSSLETYLHTCVDGYAKDYVTKLRCPQKIRKTLIVLDGPVGEGRSLPEGEADTGTMLDFVADPNPNGQALADMRSDVKNVLARLDDLSRLICEMIMSGKELKEIYPALGISKTRFYGVVFPKVQVVFKRLLES